MIEGYFGIVIFGGIFCVIASAMLFLSSWVGPSKAGRVKAEHDDAASVADSYDTPRRVDDRAAAVLVAEVGVGAGGCQRTGRTCHQYPAASGIGRSV